MWRSITRHETVAKILIPKPFNNKVNPLWGL